MTSPAPTAMPICSQWPFTQAALLCHQELRSSSGLAGAAVLGAAEAAAAKREKVTSILVDIFLGVRRSGAGRRRPAPAPDRPKTRVRNVKDIGSRAEAIPPRLQNFRAPALLRSLQDEHRRAGPPPVCCRAPAQHGRAAPSASAAPPHHKDK